MDNLSKNDIIELEITALTSEGSGIGRYNGIAVFVPFTAVGDIIACRILKVRSNYCYGKIERIIKASPDRIEPDCPAYAKCGGCVFRHISYEAELKAKSDAVRDSFLRIGGFSLLPEPIIGCKGVYRYRNKVQLPAAQLDDKCVCGFFSPRSHRVIPINDCLIQPEVFTRICERVTEYASENKVPVYEETSGKGLLRHIYLRIGAHSNEIMLTLVVTKGTDAFNGLAETIVKEFPQIKTVVLNVNPDKTNVILGCKDICLYGTGKISDTMSGNSVEISPHSFYQINTPAAENVYAAAKEYAALTGRETVLDLYCGIGTVGLSMADGAKKLIGVEVIPDAVENARANAERNGVKNAEFICGDAGDIAETLADRGECPDVILLDPPRKGADNKTLDAIIKMNPKKLVYISCGHSTCARDLKYLCENGYRLERYRPCDMFPRTAHVETVCLLSKLNTKQHIEVEVKMDELDLTSAESKATYEEIKEYVLEHTGLKVSRLYIAQVKRKHGIIERANYNLPKNEDAKQPVCPPEKEKAITEALLHFGMI